MKRRWLAGALLGLVTLAAFLWRVAAAMQIEYPSVDGVNYMTVARSLVRDGVMQFSTFPPGWSLLISVPLLGFGTADGMDVLHAAQTANVVFGTLVVPLVFVLLRPHFGAWSALAGAACVALLPDAVILSSVDLSEMSYLAFFVAAWIAWHRERWWSAGALFGVAYLVRPEALIVLFAAVGVASLRDRRLHWRPLVAAAPFVVAYVLFVHGATGEWTLSGKAAFLERAERAEGSAVRRWFTNAGTLLEGSVLLLGLPLVVLAAWGLVRRRGVEAVVFVPMLLLPVFTFRMEARYWVPLVPFVLWFALAGGRDVAARFAGRARWSVAVGLALAAVIGLGWATREDFGKIGVNYEAYDGLRQAGRWIAANSAPDDVVVDYKPYTAFWAGRPYAKLPQRDDLLSTVDRIRESGHDYLVVSVFMCRALTPQLRPLVSPEPLDERLARRIELVYVVRVPDDPRQTTAVYRVKPFGG